MEFCSMKYLEKRHFKQFSVEKFRMCGIGRDKLRGYLGRLVVIPQFWFKKDRFKKTIISCK